MRVLHFAGSFPPTPGGTSQRVAGLTGDPRNEHFIIVPDLHMGLGMHPRERVDRRELRRVGPPHGVRSTIPILRDRILADRFLKEAVGIQPDILHAHNPMACALASLRYKQTTNVPMVYEAHGIMSDLSYDQPIFGPIKALNRLSQACAKRIAFARENAVLQATDRIIVQTDAAGERLRKIYGLCDKSMDVIYNGVDTERFDPQRWREVGLNIRKEREWEGQTIILYAGYLNAVNGVDFLMDCIDRIAADPIGNLRFAILGQGPLESLVKKNASKHVGLMEFVGSVAPTEMPAYYAACDVFTIPRPAHMLGEIFLPMKLLEAMAMGKTLVVSDVAAMANVIEHERNGLLFRKGDHADYIKTLTRTIHQSTSTGTATRIEQWGTQARADVLARFTWQSSQEALQTVYSQVVSRREAFKA